MAIYRAAKAANAPETLPANWRWKLTLWREGDREVFDAVMKDARQKQVAEQEAQKAASERKTADSTKTATP